jgi:hypothetical protein
MLKVTSAAFSAPCDSRPFSESQFQNTTFAPNCQASFSGSPTTPRYFSNTSCYG